MEMEMSIVIPSPGFGVPLDGAVRLLFRLGIPLIVQFLTAAQSHFHFYTGGGEIEGQGDQRIAVPGHQAVEPHDLPPMHQQFPIPQGIPVVDVALLIGGDVDAGGEQFALPDLAVRILQIDLTGPQTFHLSTEQRDAGFIGIFHEILVRFFRSSTRSLCASLTTDIS